MVRETSLHCRDAAVKKGQLKRHGLGNKRLIYISQEFKMVLGVKTKQKSKAIVMSSYLSR